MTKKFRLITGLLAAVLAAVMLSSAVYIAVEANHNCSGEDCAICHQLQVCENLLKSIGLAGAAAVFVRYDIELLHRLYGPAPGPRPARRVQR